MPRVHLYARPSAKQGIARLFGCVLDPPEGHDLDGHNKDARGVRIALVRGGEGQHSVAQRVRVERSTATADHH